MAVNQLYTYLYNFTYVWQRGVWWGFPAHGHWWQAGHCRCIQLPELDRKCKCFLSQRSRLWGLPHPDWGALSTERQVHRVSERKEDWGQRAWNLMFSQEKGGPVEDSHLRCYTVQMICGFLFDSGGTKTWINVWFSTGNWLQDSVASRPHACVHAAGVEQMYLVSDAGNRSPRDYNRAVSHVSGELRGISHGWVCKHTFHSGFDRSKTPLHQCSSILLATFTLTGGKLSGFSFTQYVVLLRVQRGRVLRVRFQVEQGVLSEAGGQAQLRRGRALHS